MYAPKENYIAEKNETKIRHVLIYLGREILLLLGKMRIFGVEI
jgi:hypothetical protein